MHSTPSTVEARGLYHIYREREVETVALRGADITLERGTWTSVMGPSGSGKSTLVHVIGGLLEPSGGSVLIEGEDITRLPAGERAVRRRRRVGVVLQRDNLHPLLDVAENIALPLRLDGRTSAEVRARVTELLTVMGITGQAGMPSGQLSGGEAQRAAIARHRPRPARGGPGPGRDGDSHRDAQPARRRAGATAADDERRSRHRRDDREPRRR
jgi:ABC-type lipoprotein export system ATPase subunit